MQPSGKQPSNRPAQTCDESEMEVAQNRAPASAVNAIMGRLGLARMQDEPGEDETTLSDSLADPSWIVRVGVVQKLGKMGKEAPLGLLLAAMRDEQSAVRVAAARALSRNPRRAAISALVAALEDSEWLVRAEAARALGAMRELAPLEPLMAALHDTDATVRASAAQALGETNAVRVLESLNASLQDEDWSVREAAALALAQLDLEGQPSPPPLLDARADHDQAMREAAEAGVLQIHPEIVSVLPPPSDSLASWLERIKTPQNTVLAGSITSSRTQEKQRRTTRHKRGQKREAAPSRSPKAMHMVEGVLAVAIIVSLFVTWLAFEMQPSSIQSQAGQNNTHSITFMTYREHDSEVEKLAWSPDGQDIASADIRGTVLIWQASTGETLMSYSRPGNVLALTWSDSRTLLAVYAMPNKEIQVVELIQSFKQLNRIIFQHTLPNMPTVAAWSPDKQLLAFDTGDGSVQIWNMDTSTPQLATTLAEKNGQIYTELDWSPDNNQIATLSADGLLDIWSVHTGLSIINLTYNYFATMATWISCGRYASGALLVDSSGTLLNWSYGHRGQRVETFLAQQTYNLINTAGLTISDLAISPDGSQLLLATSDGLIQTRDMLSGNLLYVYTGHSAQVNDIEWSPVDQRIATASMDGTVQVWQES